MSPTSQASAQPQQPLSVVGRYALYGKLATGGMATVHFGRLLGPVGFSRTVAIKRLHPQFAKDPDFVTMFLDEARVAARIQHPNVVSTIDVVSAENELFLVMDYVRGESFSRLLRKANKDGIEVPEGFIGGIMAGMLHGLHAAHEATDERGEPLKVVHRDISPQNVLVGVDGVARVLDFGVAKAAARVQITRDGQMKGKLSYMSPEQLQARHVDRRSDIFAAGVVLWEALTGKRLFTGDEAREVLIKILKEPTPPPSSVNPKLRPELDELVLRALEKEPDYRYQTSREFAIAVEETMRLLSPRETGEWVEEIAGESLEKREAALAEIESVSSVSELSSVSDAGFVKTLSRTLPGTQGPPKRVAGRPPPPPGRSRSPAPPKPGASRRFAPPPLPPAPSASRPPPSKRRAKVPPMLTQEDEATSIYQPDQADADAVTPPPLPIELPDEPTQIYDPMNIGDVTSPRHRSTAPPPNAPSTRRNILAAGGVLFASIVGGALVAQLFTGGHEQPSEPPAPTATAAVVAAAADAERSPSWDELSQPLSSSSAKADEPPPSETKVMDLDALPAADDSKSAGDVPAKSDSTVAQKPKTSGAKVSGATGSKGASGSSKPAPQKPKAKPSGSKADCSRPFYVDKKGIRRIKPGCL